MHDARQRRTHKGSNEAPRRHVQARSGRMPATTRDDTSTSVTDDLTPPPQVMIAYLRKSKADRRKKEVEAHGLAAQRRAIIGEAERRGWELVWAEPDDGWSGANAQRPGLTWALEQLAAGNADGLVVSNLDRLGRSLLDFANIAHTAEKQGWTIHALNLGVDMNSPVGRLIFSVLMSFAQLERELISQRTREALAAAKAAGVRLGRPSGIDPETAAAIVTLREEGCTLQAIADVLNQQSIPCAQGGKRWRVSTVRGVLGRVGESMNLDTRVLVA